MCDHKSGNEMIKKVVLQFSFFQTKMYAKPTPWCHYVEKHQEESKAGERDKNFEFCWVIKKRQVNKRKYFII